MIWERVNYDVRKIKYGAKTSYLYGNESNVMGERFNSDVGEN